MALRRSRQEISSGCGALASARDESTDHVTIACGEAQYDAPYSAKPSMKNARTGDQGAVFGGSSGVIAGGYGLTSAPSSLGARVTPSCTMPPLSRKSTRNARLETLYSLVTLLADSDEFDMRCSHELSADERYLLQSTWRRKPPPNSCRWRRSPTWRAHEQTNAFSRAKRPAHTCLTKALEGIGVSARRDSP
jgi:hypothetical protein